MLKWLSITTRSVHILIVMANNEDISGFDDLAVFLDICDTGGFRKTAQRLALSPSSVSERVKRLERQIGVPLLTGPHEVSHRQMQGGRWRNVFCRFILKLVLP